MLSFQQSGKSNDDDAGCWAHEKNSSRGFERLGEKLKAEFSRGLKHWSRHSSLIRKVSGYSKNESIIIMRFNIFPDTDPFNIVAIIKFFDWNWDRRSRTVQSQNYLFDVNPEPRW